MKQTPQILRVEDLSTSDSKWIGLKQIHYKDEDGKDRTWEAAERKTRGSGGVDAVAILALLQAEGQKTHTIIIEQYRPPLAKTCIEFPAGLIDGDETAEQAAIRELREETGYEAKEVVDSSPVMWCDPGMTTANMKVVTLRVPVTDMTTLPKQHLDPGEHIVRRIVAIEELYDVLREYETKGDTVDARLANFAMGLSLTKMLNL
ncbi:hypothetical protein CALVIDRAFT_544830 [Calocera viscosa TUFC12733]|uniref:Nudix hydrolase domain-containing protein n=1 Tax=Calocera viscosa (strain TUFC12733) TaxID=1330018 RepID=A0A167NYM2_CALVF|nr:hypothetical protein CALVIDRAFT_544830 [Calocera viscosa TUFC12733]